MPRGIPNESPRAELAQWIREQIDGKSSVKLPELADAAVAHFSADKAFVRRFMEESFRPLVYDTAQRVMQQTRPKGDVIVLGDEIVSRDEAKQRASKMANRWSKWLEHVGTKHVKLTDMTKRDLLTAAEERRRRGDAEYELAALWEALAERLEGNERVGERFTASEIERVRASLNDSDGKTRKAA